MRKFIVTSVAFNATEWLVESLRATRFVLLRQLGTATSQKIVMSLLSTICKAGLRWRLGMSAFGGKADILPRCADVCF